VRRGRRQIGVLVWFFDVPTVSGSVYLAAAPQTAQTAARVQLKVNQ